MTKRSFKGMPSFAIAALSLFELAAGLLPAQGSCGVPAVQPSIRTRADHSSNSERIMSGDSAVAGSWPWTVSIRKYVGNAKISGHFCGGTLIYANVVVTAAHCVAKYRAEQLAVVVGVSDFGEMTSRHVYFVSAR